MRKTENNLRQRFKINFQLVYLFLNIPGCREPVYFILKQTNIVLKQVTIIPTASGSKKEINGKVWLFHKTSIEKNSAREFYFETNEHCFEKTVHLYETNCMASNWLVCFVVWFCQ